MKDCNTASSSPIYGLTSSAMPTNRTWVKASDEELIEQARMLYRELGRSPTAAEFNHDKRTASTTAAVNRFGGWNDFMRKAGLKHRCGRPKKYTRNDLIRQARMLTEETGTAPTMNSFNEHPETASSKTVIQLFGSWSNFIKVSGLRNRRKNSSRRYTDDELIAQVQMLAKKLGRSPTRKEFEKYPNFASGGTIAKRYGAWNDFLKAAGLEINRYRHNQYDKKILIGQLQMLAEENNGAAPSMVEFDRDKRTASARTAIRFFGRWDNFLEAAGF